MINIYSETFMLATRTDRPWLRDVPTVPHEKRLHFFNRRKTREQR